MASAARGLAPHIDWDAIEHARTGSRDVGFVQGTPPAAGGSSGFAAVPRTSTGGMYGVGTAAPAGVRAGTAGIGYMAPTSNAGMGGLRRSPDAPGAAGVRPTAPDGQARPGMYGVPMPARSAGGRGTAGVGYAAPSSVPAIPTTSGLRAAPITGRGGMPGPGAIPGGPAADIGYMIGRMAPPLSPEDEDPYGRHYFGGLSRFGEE